MPPKVNQFNDSYLSALWHGRLGYAGNNVMDNIHKHVIGIDKSLRRNPFYRCPFCLPNKMYKRSLKKTARKKTRSPSQVPTQNQCRDPLHDEDNIKGESGQHFHMDFGFVRGSEYKLKSETGSTITFIDGFNSYIIIIDRATRCMWIIFKLI